VKQNIWNWPGRDHQQHFLTSLFFLQVRALFADAGLQFVYIAICHLRLVETGCMADCSMESSKLRQHSLPAVFGLFWGWPQRPLAIPSTWVLRRYTPSTVPFADGLTVALFLTAQFMMSKKDSSELVVLDCGRRAGHRTLHLQAACISRRRSTARSSWRCASRGSWSGQKAARRGRRGSRIKQ